MPTLTITRQTARADHDEPYRLLIDNVERERLADGETRTIELPAGTHRVQLKDANGSSPALAVHLDADVRMACKSGVDLKPSRGLFFLMRAFTFGTHEWIKLWVEDGSRHV